MALYTTYNKIMNGLEFNPDQYLKWLEDRITGNRMTYGLDTPIYLVDILDKSGLHDALIMMDYCVQDTVALRKIMAIEIARGHQAPWIQYTALKDQGKLENLLIFAERYMDSQHTDTTRYDYCGDPIPGSGDISMGQIETLIAEIETIYKGLTYETGPLPQYTWTPVGYAPRTNEDVPEYQRDTWQYMDEYDQDWFHLSSGMNSNDLNEYATKDITTALNNDPDSFYKDTLDLQKRLAEKGTPYYKQRVRIWPKGQDAVLKNHSAYACRYAAQSAITAARLATKNMGSVDSVALYAQRAFSSMGSAMYRNIARGLMRINELSSLLMPTPAFPPDDPVYEIEMDIINQAQIRRAELFRDKDFIKSYDKNFDNLLDKYEFLALEQAVRAEMADRAYETSEGYREMQMDTLRNHNIVESIDAIIRPFLV